MQPTLSCIETRCLGEFELGDEEIARDISRGNATNSREKREKSSEGIIPRRRINKAVDRVPAVILLRLTARQPLAGCAEFFLSPGQLPKKQWEESINARVAIRRAVNQRPEEALRRF